jgi:uncharacterized protein (TIGR03437 family)
MRVPVLGGLIFVMAGSALVSAAPEKMAGMGSLPLSFEPNRGQAPRGVDFVARGAGYGIELRRSGLGVHLPHGNVALRFVGAKPGPAPAAQQELPGKVNYLVGADRSAWKRDIPTFGRVEYAGVYAGIDVIYYGQQNRLEFDFRVHPGADAGQIRMAAGGGTRPVVEANGDLRLGALRQHKPVAFQTAASGERQAVECRYRVERNGEVRLAIGAYDRSRELIIDPVLSYSTYFGGTGNEAVTAIKADAAGNVYFAGSTTSSGLATPGSLQEANRGANTPLNQARFGDAFVAKMNAAGTSLAYRTYLGGSGDDLATGLAIDAAGSVYVSGATQSSNFPVSEGAFQRGYRGFTDDNFVYNPGDAFVVKLNAAGNQLVYGTYLGGGLNDLAVGIAVDRSGNAVVVGGTQSTDFPTTAGAISRTFRGSANFGPSVAGDAFISILNAAGTALTYSTYLGGRSKDAAAGVALDGQGNIYVCGLTFSGDFPVTQGAYQTQFRGLETSTNYQAAAGDAFVAKLTAQGALVYNTFLGGAFREGASAIAVDGAGAAYITGNTASSDFPATAGAPQRSYGGRQGVGTTGETYYGDAFAAKLNAAGSGLAYATYIGGRGDEAGLGIAVDAAGSAYVTGFSTSADFPVTTDALQRTNAGFGGQGLDPLPEFNVPERARNTGDAFLVKLGGNGELTYSSFFGGNRDDAGLSVALDAAGNAYVAGNTLSTTLAPTAGAVQGTYGGGMSAFPRGDGFVAKFAFGAPAAAPARLAAVTGFSGSGTAGSTLATPFTVEVLDAQGAAVSGVNVTFAATGATVNPATATTSASGRASTTVTLGTAAGSGTVTATVAGLTPVTAALTITAAGATGPVVRAAVNGASFQTAVAPGSWMTVFIDRTAAAGATATTVPLPVSLGGFRVLVNGAAVPIYAVAPLSPGTQLNVQLPYETAVGTAQVVVEQAGAASAAFALPVQATAPGIFVFGDNRAVVQNVGAGGALTVNTEANPIRAAGLIIAYFTGQGALDNPVPTGGVATGSPLSLPRAPYSATLGTRALDVKFLGMTPGQIALGQANLEVPADMAPGTYPLVLTIGGVRSNGPSVTVSAAQP